MAGWGIGNCWWEFFLVEVDIHQILFKIIGIFRFFVAVDIHQILFEIREFFEFFFISIKWKFFYFFL